MSCTPKNPMVLLIIIPMKNGYFIGNINPTFSDKPKCVNTAVASNEKNMLTGDSTRHIQMLRDGFSIFGGNMDSRSRCEEQEEVRESCLTQENFL